MAFCPSPLEILDLSVLKHQWYVNATSLIAVQLSLACFQETLLEVMVVTASMSFNAERTTAMQIFHTQATKFERTLT